MDPEIQTTIQEESNFVSAVIPKDLLERAIGFIASNKTPIEVFGEEALEQWAQENGYVKAE